MVYILKGGRSSSGTPKKQFTSWNQLPKGYEESLLGTDKQVGKIEKGDLTDYDISFILDKGDRKLKQKFDAKYRREKKNAEHVQRLHGNDWTNKDNNGNLFKIIDTPIDPEKPQYDPIQADKMKTVLKENL